MAESTKHSVKLGMQATWTDAPQSPAVWHLALTEVWTPQQRQEGLVGGIDPRRGGLRFG